MISIDMFQDINLNTDAVITVQGEDFDYPGEPLLAQEVYLADHQTSSEFWKEVSSVASGFRNQNLCPILSIKMLITEVLHDQH